ncbi:MAG: response regulator [Bacteroidota bacterium]
MTKDKKNYSILIVEDNRGDFVLINNYLRDQIEDPQINHAENFKDARSRLTEAATNYDIILLDLSLPDATGEKLISEINLLCKGAPVVVLTGFADIEFSIKSLSIGAADYLLKDDINATSLYKSIVHNIERRKISNELEESEKRYSALFQLSPLPGWVQAADSLAILDVNDAAIKFYGYTREEFLSMAATIVSPEENAAMTDCSGHIPGESKQQLYGQNIFRHIKKNGEEILADVQSSTIILKGEKAKIVLAVDVTERQLYIKTIESQNKILQEIAWIQSHVVRAPLAKMMGLIDILQNHSISEPEKNKLLTHILNAAGEFNILIKDIAGRAEQVKINIAENEI